MRLFYDVRCASASRARAASSQRAAGCAVRVEVADDNDPLTPADGVSHEVGRTRQPGQRAAVVKLVEAMTQLVQPGNPAGPVHAL